MCVLQSGFHKYANLVVIRLGGANARQSNRQFKRARWAWFGIVCGGTNQQSETGETPPISEFAIDGPVTSDQGGTRNLTCCRLLLPSLFKPNPPIFVSHLRVEYFFLNAQQINIGKKQWFTYR